MNPPAHHPRVTRPRPIAGRLGAILIALALASFAAGQSADKKEEVILRTSIDPDREWQWVGQRVLLHIDVLGMDGWATVERLPSFEVDGAYVIRTESQGVRLDETIGGGSYTGQRYELSVYPQRAGTIRVPALDVEVLVKQWGAGAESATSSHRSPALEFEARLPPGAEAGTPMISTTKATAGQRWNPEPADLMVGDALTRTLTFSADDVSGMAFTPLTFTAPDGVAVYPKDPSVDDRSDRGSLSGSREETVTYLFQREGTFKLPDLAFTWWDLSKEELRRETLEGLEVTVAPNPDLAAADGAAAGSAGDGSAAGSGWGLPWPVWFLAVFVLIAFAPTLQRRLREWDERRRARHEEKEATFFKKFLAAAESGEPRDALNTLMRWLDRIHTGPDAARLDLFLLNHGDDDARHWSRVLTEAATGSKFGGDASAARRGLATSVIRARRRWKRSQRRQEQIEKVLPALNP